jgi:prophage tail gpP-like protein
LLTVADKLHKFDVVVSLQEERKGTRSGYLLFVSASQVTTYSTLSSEHGTPTKTVVSKAKAKAAATLQSDSESGSESDGERFGKSVKKAKPKTSPLFQMKWLRVVCGEF